LSTPKQLAARLREVYLSGTWIANTNYQAQLSNIKWEDAIYTNGQHNSIALLAFHINYYIDGLIQVLNGGDLLIKDKYSFDTPPITCEEDWQKLLTSFLHNAETFAQKVESLDEDQLNKPFIDIKYGTYLRNIEGVIEHGYYFLGQISLLRKMVG
jgi:hypothetical protein